MPPSITKTIYFGLNIRFNVKKTATNYEISIVFRHFMTRKWTKYRLRFSLAFLLIVSCVIFISTLNLKSSIRSFLNIDQLESIQRQLEKFDSKLTHQLEEHPNIFIFPSPNQDENMRGWRIIRDKITQIISRDHFTPPELNTNTNSCVGCISGFLEVYIWWESCYLNVNSFKASLGFPYAPHEAITTHTLFIHRGRNYYGERIFGYLLPTINGFYRFSLTSITPIEVWLSIDCDPQNSQLILSNTENGQTQPTLHSQSIYLNSQSYFLEILHLSTDSEDIFHIKWLQPGALEYIYITNNHFQTAPMNPHPELPSSFPMHIPENDTTYTTNILASRLPILPRRVYNHSFPNCYKLDRFAEPHTLLQYHGIYELERIFIYPEDGSQLYNGIQHVDQTLSIAGNDNLPSDTSDYVLSTFLAQTASDLLAINLTFSGLNQIESKSSKGVAIRYLIDITLQDIITLELYRLIDIFFIEGRYSSQLCISPDYGLKLSGTFVYFVIIVKNLSQPLKAFIHELEKLWFMTGDTNFGLIVVDFTSTDLNVSYLLETSHLYHYKYIALSGPFIKVQGQNAALQSIQDEDAILILFDLHINLPPLILHEIRTHTVKHVSAYAPIVFRLQCGHSLVNPLGFWEVWGTGLFAMFRSDWGVVGGMDTDNYAQSWGGEDSDLLDRTLALGYEVERKAIPGLVHFYHTHFGMWNL